MNTKQKFLAVLTKHGALNANTESLLVKGIDGEDNLLKEWRSYASRFIHKHERIAVGMHIERLPHNETRCYPCIQVITA